ncbi:MAG TPA: YihY family inner membrane protein, partial [Gammaproteobacteria bacterium]|nr:YihY family inner membrane protein [Gammaproteobacteria bacterium]
MKEKLQKLLRFMRFVLERARRDHLINNSASLTYTTLLSLVPLMAVGLSVLSAFPVFDKVQVEIQEYVIQNFVPAAGDAIQVYLQQFTSNVSRLTGIGIGFLVLTALMLMSRIDESMNAIWNV